VLDRGSTFTDDEIVKLITEKTVPLAMDVYYFEHAKNNSLAEFYRALIAQRPDLKPGATSQGFYLFDPEGKLYKGYNSRGCDALKKAIRDVVASYKPPALPSGAMETEDPSDERTPPKGTVIVDCFAKITEAEWPPAKGLHQKLFQTSTGREHLWIMKNEASSLSRGKMPKALVKRIAKFHLNDFTRGEPNIWQIADLKKMEMDLEPDGNGYRLTGSVEIGDERGRLGYRASLYGRVESSSSKLTKFDVVAKGLYHGEGMFTKGAPPGEFTLVIAMRLADVKDGEALKAPPQGVNNYNAYVSP
jgi:hypothetical protein